MQKRKYLDEEKIVIQFVGTSKWQLSKKITVPCVLMKIFCDTYEKNAMKLNPTFGHLLFHTHPVWKKIIIAEESLDFGWADVTVSGNNKALKFTACKITEMSFEKLIIDKKDMFPIIKMNIGIKMPLITQIIELQKLKDYDPKNEDEPVFITIETSSSNAVLEAKKGSRQLSLL